MENHLHFTAREEIANSLTHGVGLVASLIALPVLVMAAAYRGDAMQVVACAVFATSLIAVYATSTAYHALPPSPTKEVFRFADHVAIYLLIAGTYTPFTVGVLRGGWGWTMFGLIWTFAALGILLKTKLGFAYPRASTVLYLAMGWLAVIAIRPMVLHMPPAGLAWIVAGGLLYTGGVAFFAWESRRYSHTVWHLFVLGGSSCHFFAVLWYAAPTSV